MGKLWIITITLALGLESVALGEKLSRIVGGGNAEDHEFPHQVILLWNVTFFIGAGSVLTPDWILTCGHCVIFPQEEITVVSGTNSLSEGGFVHSAEKLIPHEGFVYAAPYPNDIGLIKVTPPLNIDGINIAPVKLPALGQITPEGTVTTAIGWGAMWEFGDIPDKLQKVQLFVANHDYCNDVYGTLWNITVSQRQICAEVPEGGKGVCKGDSGGPILVNGEVIGIASWVYGCAKQGYPSVFTNVAAYIDWIKDNMS